MLPCVPLMTRHRAQLVLDVSGQLLVIQLILRMEDQAKGRDSTAQHVEQLQDHFLATAAAEPAAAIATLALMVVTHACWEGGTRSSSRSQSTETRPRQRLSLAALLHAMGQVLALHAATIV